MASIVRCLNTFTIGSCSCCCGEEAYGYWFRSLPPCFKSRSTRLAYTTLFFIVIIFCLLLLSPYVQLRLRHFLPYCRNISNVTLDCDLQVAYLGIYRICFASFVFFSLFSLMMVDVKCSADPRTYMQSGFWLPKFVFLIILIVGAFYINADSIFDILWMYVGTGASFVFTLLQFLFFINFAFFWANNWMTKFESTRLPIYYGGLMMCALFNFGLCLTGVILMALEYTQGPSCTLHRTLLVFAIILLLIIIIASIVSQIQNAHPRSGLLLASMVNLYVTYITWSAFLASPYVECVPKSDTELEYCVVSVFLLVLVVVYSTLSTSFHSSLIKLASGLPDSRQQPKNSGMSTEGEMTNEGQQNEMKKSPPKVWDDEIHEVTYNWSAFHFFLALASLYLMMNLTFWYLPGSSSSPVHHHIGGDFWVKMASSWLAAGIYLFLIIGPTVLSDEDIV